MIHDAPALVTATLTGKHVGNTLPSTPRQPGIQKAGIVSDTSQLVRTLLAISVGSITARGVYNGIRNGRELQFLTSYPRLHSRRDRQNIIRAKEFSFTHW